MFFLGYAFFIQVLTFGSLGIQRFAAAALLPQAEVNALNLITKKMGAVGWDFNADSCGKLLPRVRPTDPDRNITCDCRFENNTCHIVSLKIKRFSLPGELPPELVQLPYLESIDFSYNYLSGTIPSEWASMQLKSIALLANRLSGNIPSYLGNFTSLMYLDLELNQFSGAIPHEIGKLVNLKRLVLSSNKLAGNLPMELSKLKNLTDFRINDNNLNGSIPDFIQNWMQLKRLEIQASGLGGPIPSSISALEALTDLRISDINVTNQAFPDLSNITGLSRLVLRKCNISGEIPTYIWDTGSLRILDLSFNKLYGKLPNAITLEPLVFIFLTGNLLTGSIPMFRKGMSVDLSYNNFSQQSSGQPSCQQRTDVTLNLFRSSLMGKDIGGACMDDLKCDKYWHSLYINCGGENLKINGSTYESDTAGGGAALFYQSNDEWGLSSTGDFMDDNDFQNAAYTVNVPSLNINGLYQTARISPLSLTYYRQCLENGNYSVRLHFAEIKFTNDNTYNSLGKRVFDISIQDHLVERDFNIEDEAGGVAKPITKKYNTTVTNGILEIRLYWAGKGTTRIPVSGVYGPLISAISVDPNFKPRFSGGGKKKIVPIIAGVVGFCLVFTALAIFWWRCYFRAKNRNQNGFEGLEIQTVSFTLKQIKAATNNFDPENKIGEGGFGPVYKGLLADGTVIAVKQLSSKSSQGNREFLNEIGMIACMQHPNLVKIHGCCIERDQLLLVYEYMENNSLARALFGPGHHGLNLDWKERKNICVGIAKGLAFLHEESRLKIVHRDIKVNNVLLDKDLNPKISDFGLAKLDEEEKTHISTRVAGTMGYMAPEYALWGYLTYKADVYSFGIVALEIVSGKHNMSCGPENKFSCLLDWACHLQQNGSLIELVDQKLGSEFSKVEAERMIKVALLCTNASPSLRPIMSEVVRMLEGTGMVPDVIPEPNSYNEDLRFKAIRGHHEQVRKSLSVRANEDSSSRLRRAGNRTSDESTDHDLCETSTESYVGLRFNSRSRDYKWTENQNEVTNSISSVAAAPTSSTSASELFDINLNSS